MTVHAVIIEDNSDSLSLMKELIKMQGATSTGIQHTETLEETLAGLDDITVIFVDLEMPLLSGYQIFDLIKAGPHADVPMIAFSAHTNEMNEVRKYGFHGFIGKPLKMAKFAGIWQKLINGEAVWEAR